MNITKIECPSCGASLKETDSKYICQYCGKEVLIESKSIEAVHNNIALAESKTQEVIATGSRSTQLELRKLQLAQELSMLEMQLSNLRAEKRRIGLVDKKTKAHKQQIQQIELEERSLVKRIENIQLVLHPPKEEAAEVVSVNERTYGSSVFQNQKSQSVTFWLAAFLGMFGVHRFYTGQFKLGLLYLFTMGLMGFGWLYDIFTIFFEKYKDGNGNLLSPMGKTSKTLATIFVVLLVILFITNLGSTGSTAAPTP
jgi:TM2 domain-containing membrane protein YozV/uncharacterized Zn finger protein (UPF0148 family)